MKRAERRKHRGRWIPALITASVLSLCVLGAFFVLGLRITKEETGKTKEERRILRDLEIRPEAVLTQPSEIRVTMIGDVLLHRQVQQSGQRADGSYNYDHLFANMRETYAAADLNLVNQEVILGGTELGLSSYPSFNGAFEVGDAIAEAGGNVVLHATNHALDKRTKGVENCMDFWKEKHPEVTVLGISKSQEERDEIFVYEKDGFKVAVLNYTYGTNGIPLPADRPYMVSLLDEKKVDADLERARELADFIIVCPHWGTEYRHEPDAMQKKWTQFFLERGVGLVIGTHPHVIQPVEMIEDGDKKMLVYYSLGNFVSRQDMAKCMIGAMADVTLCKDARGNVTIKDYAAEPLVTHIGTTTDYTTYFLKDYTRELAAKNGIRVTDRNFTLQYCQDLSRKVFGEQRR